MTLPSLRTRKARPCWRERGLTAEGGQVADLILPLAIVMTGNTSADIARAVLEEAIFRQHELPNRTAKFRREYLKQNGAR